MNSFLVWLEATDFSTWMRESPSVFAFPAILSCHTVGMGLVAGINASIALRILGAAPAVPIREMRRFLPVMWFGFWLNAISGVALLIAYPTKALTNPVFYLKLTLIAIAVWLVGPISRAIFPTGDAGRLAPRPERAPTSAGAVFDEGGRGVAVTAEAAAVSGTTSAVSTLPAGAKRLAVMSLVCWAGAITAGRLLAYTFSRLMAII
jgi:hypothetical protein